MKNFKNIILALSLIIMPGCKWFSCDCTHEGHDHHHHGKAPETTTTTESAGLININSLQEFEEKVLKATKPALVDFSAKWCGPCQAMKPIVEELAQELSSKYMFVNVNVDAA